MRPNAAAACAPSGVLVTGLLAAEILAAGVLAAIVLAAGVLTAGCTRGPATERPAAALAPTAAGYPQGALTLIAPANPGGGWDQTARQIQQVWTETGILGVPVEVINRGGAGGTIGLADLVTRHRGDPRTLMVFGQVMLGAIRTNASPVSIDQTVPLARLLNEYEVVTVPADSPHGTLEEVLEDFRRDPAAVSWAGGSAGGIDHILAGLIAQAAGVDPRRVNYIAYAGGGRGGGGRDGRTRHPRHLGRRRMEGVRRVGPHAATGGLRARAHR